MEATKKTIPLTAAVISFAFLLCAGIYAWTQPGGAPPSGNISAPINTSANGQTKSGNFNILGNVGIGTESPTQKLDVNGYAKGRTGLCIGDDCRTAWGTLGTDQNCEDGKVVTGITAAGAIACSAGGTGDPGACTPSCPANYCGPNGCGGTCACAGTCTDNICTATPQIPDGPCIDGPMPVNENKRIFVTSQVYPRTFTDLYDLTLMHIDDNYNKINKYCNDAAIAGGMQRAGEAKFRGLYYAGYRQNWGPSRQLTYAAYWNGRELADGTTCRWEPVTTAANGFFSLKEGSTTNFLLNPIQYNEYGRKSDHNYVWTGFRPLGMGNYEPGEKTFSTCPSPYTYYDTQRGNTTPIMFTSRFINGGRVDCSRTEVWLGDNWAKDEKWAFNPTQTIPTTAAVYCVER